MIDTDESDFDEDVFGLSDDEKDDWAPPPPPPAKKPPSKSVLKFRKALGLRDPEGSENGESATEAGPVAKRVETLASKLKKDAPPPEVVVFKSKSSTAAARSSRLGKNEPGSSRREEEKPADLRKLKNDVYRFGVKGFEKTKRESAMADLLCSLGAKPDPNPYKNYKQLKEERRAEKEAQKRAKAEGAHYSSTLASRVGGGAKKPLAKHAKKDRNKVAGFDVQPGKFRDGVQFVNPRELKRSRK